MNELPVMGPAAAVIRRVGRKTEPRRPAGAIFSIVRAVQRYEAALEEVRPYVGDLRRMASDNAGSVYKRALRELGHDVTHVTRDTAQIVWGALKNRKPPAARPGMAADSATVTARNEMFPNGNRLKTSYY